MSKNKTFTIEPDERGEGFWVWAHSTYPRYSVLAGQPRRRRVYHFDTIKEAQETYPEAEVQQHPSSHFANQEQGESFERSPQPDWFDPADAGEEW